MNNDNLATKPAGEMSAERTRNGQFFRPNVDILEKADELLLLADLPGAKSDQIDIHFEKGALTLHAAVPDRQSKDQRYQMYEYGVGDYYRTFQVSETIDAGRIAAEFADGVLTLHLPKSEAFKPRKIRVN
jgi:HSP20 family protein